MDDFFLFTNVENYAIIANYMCTVTAVHLYHPARWQSAKAVENLPLYLYEQAEK